MNDELYAERKLLVARCIATSSKDATTIYATLVVWTCFGT